MAAGRASRLPGNTPSGAMRLDKGVCDRGIGSGWRLAQSKLGRHKPATIQKRAGVFTEVTMVDVELLRLLSHRCFQRRMNDIADRLASRSSQVRFLKDLIENRIVQSLARSRSLTKTSICYIHFCFPFSLILPCQALFVPPR